MDPERWLEAGLTRHSPQSGSLHRNAPVPSPISAENQSNHNLFILGGFFSNHCGENYVASYSFMILIRFSDAPMEKRGLAYLAGRFNGKSWTNGHTLVPEEALSHLAAEGINFTVQGRLNYEKAYYG